MRTKDSWVLPVVILAELRKASSALFVTKDCARTEKNDDVSFVIYDCISFFPSYHRIFKNDSDCREICLLRTAKYPRHFTVLGELRHVLQLWLIYKKTRSSIKNFYKDVE